jgi:hypothetical protein
LGAALGQHLAAADRGEAGAETVPTLPDDLGWLISALHDGKLQEFQVNLSACL